MNAIKDLNKQSNCDLKNQNRLRDLALKLSEKTERRIMKIILLQYLHSSFCELFNELIHHDQNHLPLECYAMDNKIIRILIKRIIDTGEYTLEGISHYTRVPFDVLYDAAYGNQNQFSVTPWIKVATLFLQVDPEAARYFFDKLAKVGEKNQADFLLLLNES